MAVSAVSIATVTAIISTTVTTVVTAVVATVAAVASVVTGVGVQVSAVVSRTAVGVRPAGGGDIVAIGVVVSVAVTPAAAVAVAVSAPTSVVVRSSSILVDDGNQSLLLSGLLFGRHKGQHDQHHLRTDRCK